MLMKQCIFFVCALIITASTLADSPRILIQDAYIRGLPPGQTTTAAFMQITNASDKAVTLKNMHSDAAETIELHQSIMENGTMKMRQIKDFQLEARASATFEAGAKHIMFLGLKKPLSEGDTVKLKLCFTDFCQLIELPVISVLNEAGSSAHHHH